MSQSSEIWPPRDEQVPLAWLVSHHVRTHHDLVRNADPIGVLTIGQHLVPLVDSVLETAMRETAGRGIEVETRFDFINPERPTDGAKLGVAYFGASSRLSQEVFDDEATELGRLRLQAAEAGGQLVLGQDDAGTSLIELSFPFWPERT